MRAPEVETLSPCHRAVRRACVLLALLLLAVGIASATDPIRRRRLGGRPLPVPLQIPGLSLWVIPGVGMFQDSTFATPATADGNPIGGARDQSGSHNDLIQATAGNRMTLKLNIQNGRSVLRCAGSHWLDNATVSPNAPGTICFVASSTVDNRWFTDTPGANGTRQINRDGSNTNLDIYPGSPHQTVTDLGVLNSIIVVFNNTASVLNFNGTETAIDTTGASGTGVRFGNSGNGSIGITGDFGEILVYSRALNASERSRLAAYLKSGFATP